MNRWPLLVASAVAALALAACGGDPSPVDVRPVGSPTATADAVPAVSPSPTPSQGTDPRFDTCAEATEAGHGPYRRDQDPEYRWYEDRDGDGVVCETE